MGLICLRLSGRFLWDCTCRGLGPWTPSRRRRRATESSTSATKPSDPGWGRRRGRSHVSADVKSLEFFVEPKCFKSPAGVWNLKLNLAVNERIFRYGFRPKLPKIVYFTLCLSLSRVFYNIMKQHKRNILTFTLDIFMRKPKLNKVQNNLRSGISLIHGADYLHPGWKV